MKFGQVVGNVFTFTERTWKCSDGVLRTQAEVEKGGYGGVLLGIPDRTLSVDKAEAQGLLEEAPEAPAKARKNTSNKARKGASNKGVS